MNSRQLNLLLLGINIGLVGIIVALLYWLEPAASSDPITLRPPVIQNTVTQISVKKFNATNLLDELTRRSLGWRGLESSNYLFYINNLRGFGCPEEIIRDIIITDVARLYARRRQSLLAEAPPFEYWRTHPEGESQWVYDALSKDLQALERERNRLVQDLLGVDFDAEMARYQGDNLAQERLFAFLPEESRQSVMSIMKTFEQLEREILARTGGVLLPEDEAQLRDLEAQREREIAKVLTPDQLLVYELNASPLATELRYELHGFDPSPEEFAALYNVRKGYSRLVEATLENNPNLDPTVREQALRDAEAALDAEMRKRLGDERFREYERALDPDYQFLLKWAGRNELPGQVADQVYNLKQTAELQRNRIEGNLDLSFEQRQRAYEAMAEETERTLSELLGPDAFAQYRQAGGQWIQELGESDVAYELIVPEIRGALEPPNP